MKVSEVLTKSAEIIGKRGWCRGSYTGPGSTVCLETAMYLVINGEDDDPFAYAGPSRIEQTANQSEAGQFLRRFMLLRDDVSLHFVNDRLLGDRENVIRVLMEAANHAAQQERAQEAKEARKAKIESLGERAKEVGVAWKKAIEAFEAVPGPTVETGFWANAEKPVTKAKSVTVTVEWEKMILPLSFTVAKPDPVDEALEALLAEESAKEEEGVRCLTP